jgi:hypothetical protein
MLFQIIPKRNDFGKEFFSSRSNSIVHFSLSAPPIVYESNIKSVNLQPITGYDRETERYKNVVLIERQECRPIFIDGGIKTPGWKRGTANLSSIPLTPWYDCPTDNLPVLFTDQTQPPECHSG